MSSLKNASAILFSSLLLANSVYSQTTQYPAYPAGMRLQVGQAVLVRNTPSLSGTCGKDNHVCTTADAVPPGQYGVVQSDPPVFESAGWWWSRIAFENGITGWASAYPPYLQQLSPPEMAQGFSFRVVGDYSGPTLTQAVCISDGVNSAATMNLQFSGTGQMGTLSCLWTNPPIGNHIQVIRADNGAGQAPSTEFQFKVTAKATQPPPVPPANLRIGPVTLTLAADGKAEK